MRRRTFLGIDIQSSGMTFAALQRERPSSRLVGARFESLDGVMNFSSRQPNIRETRRFVEALKRGTQTLAGAEERVALSLPDRVGRMYLSDLDSPVKSHQEGVEILKWRLKSVLPGPPAQVQLDYQVLDKREEGRQRCVVSAMALPVLEQYEDLVAEAGCHAVVIDYHSLNLFNYYRPRLDLGDEFVMVAVEGDVLSLQYIHGHVLCYQRVRNIRGDAEQIFQELNRSLVDAQASFPAIQRCAVFAHVDAALEAQVMDVLTAVFDREVLQLDPLFKRFAGFDPSVTQPPTGAVVAALGAAERLM